MSHEGATVSTHLILDPSINIMEVMLRDSLPFRFFRIFSTETTEATNCTHIQNTAHKQKLKEEFHHRCDELTNGENSSTFLCQVMRIKTHL